MAAERVNEGKGYIDDRWFMEAGGKVTLAGVRCRQCERVFFPKKEVCPLCYDGELTDVPLSMRGTLHTFTRSEMGVAGLKAPYVFGFVDLPEGIKLFGLIVDCDPWDKVLQIGMAMDVFVAPIRRDPSGKEIVAYQFRPAPRG